MLWAQRVSFDAVQPGDVLPVVIKWETEESIRRINARLGMVRPAQHERGFLGGSAQDERGAPGEDAQDEWEVGEQGEPVEGPEAEAEAEGFGELDAAAVREYVVELLEKGFPAERVGAPESSFTLEMTEGVKAGDIISLSGRVVSKEFFGSLGMVECQIVVAAQEESGVGETARGERVIGRGVARVALLVKEGG